MPLQSHRYHRSLQALTVLLVGALLTFVLPAGVSTAVQTDATRVATSEFICKGFDSCQGKGLSHQGYKTAKSKMYWNMYSGVNCTNYVAYRMIRAGGSATRPAQLRPGRGDATYWGTSFGYNSTPMVGSIAWWKAGTNGGGSAGHVAYVEQVVSATEIVISESNYGSEFDWRRIRKGGPWPTGFIHYKDVTLTATAAPTIVGAPRVGATLGATPGAWSPAATAYRYQWYAAGVAVPGATGSTFTPGPAHVGQGISVAVIAGRASYVTGIAGTAPTAATAPGTQTVTTAPAIQGTAQVDQTLSLSVGSYNPRPTSTAVQWLADGVPIPGATAVTLRLTQDLGNKRIAARVTTASPGYTTLVTATAPTGPVQAPDIRVATPGGIRGRLLVGETLTADPGVLQPADAQATYVWMRDGTPIPGATAKTYAVKPRDIGRQISVRVQLSRSGYRSKALVLGPGREVKAPVDMRLKVAARAARQAWVKVIVKTPDSRQPAGSVWVKMQGRKHRVRLVRGVGKVHLTGLRPGFRGLVALYVGDARTMRVRKALKVQVRAVSSHRHR
ncbi:CHAP domain-containing protein [Nocardioides terrae]|uniref:CHAP domain-containing protein n=1 Tax=Nocardioides terrae TaxID=574651 RepID=A0A1I1DUR9_9ACTN|nr:CHAP domain-containing protein [Nocardioides terrae]SFB76313.1 CHAP domain-containing protein [Nocardioides terrae]